MTDKAPLPVLANALFALLVALGVLGFFVADLLVVATYRLCGVVSFVAIWSMLLAPLLLWRRSRAKWGCYLVFLLLILAIHLDPSEIRKRFYWDYCRVEAGMSADEVDGIMAPYIRGTGWSTPRPDARSQLIDPQSGRAYAYSTSDGEMNLDGCVVFRHSRSGRFASDWAVFVFRNGNVVSKQFMPD